MQQILAKLNEKQREAVLHTEGACRVIAGAGSGKTSVLTYRISYMIKEKNIDPRNILAITFTNKASKEMKERVELLLGKDISNDIEISTFHSFCSKVIKHEIKHIKELKPKFSIIDDDEQKGIIKDTLLRLDIDMEKYKPDVFLTFISNCKNDLIKPEQVVINSYSQEMFQKVYAEYQKKLQYNNACDFDDLLLITAYLFMQNPYVLEQYQNKFKYILIDEYQDTNKSQYKIANLLSKKHLNLFVVGDIDQCIYGFRGADYKNILNFKNDYPNSKTIFLEENYRSTPTILKAANELIKNNIMREEKNLWTKNREKDKITFCTSKTEKGEAIYICDKILEHRKNDNKDYKDFCILYRTNAQSRAFEEVLITRGIPYNIIGSLKFYDRKEIKDTIAYLKFLNNPYDLISLARIINTPKRSIGDKSFSKIIEFCEKNEKNFFDGINSLGNDIFSLIPKKGAEKLLEFKKIIEETLEFSRVNPVAKTVFKLMEDVGYLADLQNKAEKESVNTSRIENVFELINIARSFVNSPEKQTLDNFLTHISLISDADQVENTIDRVTLMTVHTSKGLEFPFVFLSGMEENVFPHWRSVFKESSINICPEMEEERNIAYVGITRAKEKLYLTNSESRWTFGVQKFNSPSRFLNEIPEELLDVEDFLC